MKNIHLLAIDCQNDFCDPNGSLFVSGANKDMERLATFITRLSGKISDIHATLDSHRTIDIAHPIFWMDGQGNPPSPFTIISADDVVNGKWTTRNPNWRQRGIDYLRELTATNKYLHCIWPPHCRIGTWGHALYPAVADALIAWETDNFGAINFVTKGSNIFTEHFGGFLAQVPDSADPSTNLNTDLVDVMKTADEILIAGEALSHCVAQTIFQAGEAFGDENIKKFTLLEDCSSNVTGFEQLGIDFVKNMTARGMKVCKSIDYLV